MTRHVRWFGIALGLTLAFGGCDVEDVDGDWRDAEIIELEQELAATQQALEQAEQALVQGSNPMADDADGDAEPEPVEDEDLAGGTYACCVPDNAEPPRGQCKKGSRFNTKDKCEGTEGGKFFSAENGQDGYQRCADECEGKIWDGNPPADAVAPAPLE
ncbi:hypothetical protein [Paraliomyxa miuraensis]|uniref:hypothetical protein n=1 Tax=Paraliomyxa miuraensis TaxID=376150 RepID=UPI002250CC6F|nr:hypothetical protein [Paraliomyxa miuraensis]MCX4243273.1 hypothetical protein [Paraliomyxa miuraensis]